ncbi:MAG: PAS domain S-box protein [Thermodesulfovibrionales bacterium]|nr:PAS domain S-box protein [Thermodesulfovibrionales bacterium]
MVDYFNFQNNIEKNCFNKLSVFFELIKAILQIDDFEILLKRVTEDTAKFFNANICLLRLLDDNRLPVKASYGLPNIEDIESELTVSVGEGIAGKTFQIGQTTIFNSLDDICHYSNLAKYVVLHSAMCTPLKIGERSIGTLGLYNKTSLDGSHVLFSADDKNLLEGFASIAAIIIDKAKLKEHLLLREKEAIEAKESEEKLKDMLERLIEDSPDAIVTTDLEGRVLSWNRGAERIYGFAKEEVIGKFLPFIPAELMSTERHYLDLLSRGESIKDLETTRVRKDGKKIDVNLTLSPVRDKTGTIIATSGISRDITEKKRIERELSLKNDQLSKLYFISSAIRSTLELDKLLRMVLTAVTIGDGFGFNRAMLFLIDEEKRVLRGTMAVGPSSSQEALEIWSKMSEEGIDLFTLINNIEKEPFRQESSIEKLCCGLVIPFEKETILNRVIKEKTPLNVTDVSLYHEDQKLFTELLGSTAYALVPLIYKDKPIGVLWVDNLFSSRPISDHDIDFLRSFTDQMAASIENARLFQRVIDTEKEMENIFESISDMLYLSSSDYTIKRINKAVVQKIGKKPEEIIGKKCYQIFHGLNEPWIKCPHHKTLKTKKPYIEEVDDPNLGGTYLISSSPFFDQEGQIFGTIHIVRDVSEIKRLRERLISSERMAALGEMAAKVAHEIRNPLLSIGGFAKRLERNLSGDLWEYAKIIVDETRRLETVLADILTFVKSGRIEHRRVDVEELLKSIGALLTPELEERGNKLIKEIEYPLILYGDPNRLKEVLINLIDNANKATDNGTITIRVYYQNGDQSIVSDDKGEEVLRTVVIEVEDNGCGIRREHISRIFDPFFTTRTTGTGLGLSISKRIIEEHGGRIEVESVWGEGTTFKIFLPQGEE